MSSLEIRNFIKKHVRVDSKFVDDFFSHYNLYTDTGSFTVSLQKTAKWLKTTKGNLKRHLSKHTQTELIMLSRNRSLVVA